MDRSDRRAILKTLLLLCNIIKFLLTNMNITALSFRICNLQASKCPFSAARRSGKQIVVTSNVLQNMNR